MEYVADELGVEPVYLPALQREISPFQDLAAARELLRLIRRVRPDILHTHTAKAGAVGRLAARLAGPARPKVVVHTFHGHVLRGYFGTAKTEAFRRLERGLARNSDALIAVSPEVRDDLVELGVAPREKIVVIRLGLDLDRRLATAPGASEALRAELGVPDGRFLVGWLGRMTEIKRVDDLLRAFARLREAGADADLLVVGDGPLRADLESLAAELGVRDRCHFTGFRSDVGAIYAACDAIALTSANEGTPVTVIEAQAAGRPVVSTNVGGVRDIVTDGRVRLHRAAGRRRRRCEPGCGCSPTTRSCAPASAPPGGRRAIATRFRGSCTTSTCSTATCSRGRRSGVEPLARR